MTDTSNDLVLTTRIPLETPNKYLGLLTLNRPKELNPLSHDLVKALLKTLAPLSADPDVCTIAVTGSGRGFCAGGDLKKYVELFDDAAAFMDFIDDVNLLCRNCQDAPKPVIGLINGFCVAGGVEIMTAFDFSYIAESARIGDGHAKYAMLGGGGAQYRLCRRVPLGHAVESLFTGELWTAQEAEKLGLVNKVVPDDKLLEAGVAFANKMAAKAPLMYKYCKELIYQTLNMRERDAEYIEAAVAHHYLNTSEDAREGLKAFAEKRTPNYKGK